MRPMYSEPDSQNFQPATMKRAIVCLILLGAPVSVVCGQSTASSTGPASDTTHLKVARAARRVGEITLDGKLDEPAWQAAPAIIGFTQSYPKPGAAPTDSTVARVLYDEAAIYVGVRMYDAHPDSIAAQLARRDASGLYSHWL